jgi:hypothetical protein
VREPDGSGELLAVPEWSLAVRQGTRNEWYQGRHQGRYHRRRRPRDHGISRSCRLRPPDSYTRREIPDGFDPERWVMIVRAEHGLSKYFLGGKPHTHHDDGPTS